MIQKEKEPEGSIKQLQQQKIPKDWKIAIMTIALVIGVFITWLPFAVSRTVALINRKDPSSDVDYYAAALTTGNSVINSYLVFVR